MRRWRRVLCIVALASLAAAPPASADAGPRHPCCADVSGVVATPDDAAAGCGTDRGAWCDVSHCTGCTAPLHEAAPAARHPDWPTVHARRSSPPLPGRTREGPPAPPPRIA